MQSFRFFTSIINVAGAVDDSMSSGDAVAFLSI